MSTPADTAGGDTAGGDTAAEPTHSPHWWLLAGVALTIVVVDQLTKWWALVALDDGNIDVAWTLRFNLVYNPGSAFSLGGGTGWGPLVTVLGVIVVGVLVWHAGVVGTRLAALAAGLIVGGTLGNLADRAFRENPRNPDAGVLGGAVVDFVDLQWWPVFNVADAGVVVGGLLLLVVSLRAEGARG